MQLTLNTLAPIASSLILFGVAILLGTAILSFIIPLILPAPEEPVDILEDLE